ncbi:hypothetical protein HOLleu_13575 [Holothuria leucospilota]|uniref:Uncharacterized protein n=1 Tax=Holothuria leucospilota TaxID=206669 RepID=A0A9Q1CBZ1_HOLLE|nr:hypothetical protein HOLleu_13575 [Holothuria leucospilota]
MENKKIKRRTSRARFTRQKRTVESLLDQEEPLKEILESFKKLELAYAEFQDKHDEYCETIEDTDQYNKEEEYLEGCQEEFLAIRAKVKAVTRKNEDSRSPKQDQAPKQPVQSHQQQTDGASSESSSIIQSNRQLTEDQSTHESTPSRPGKTRLKPRIAKPKLPIFTGDVREYWTFKDDFRHMIDQLYEPRDAVSILRTSLTGRPLEMLTGIGTDYNACWEYLDMTYGDPRVISDAITQDITKFRPLKEGEDARFSELAHLVRRSYNILKQVGKESDFDNNHMLAIIEQKMTPDDRKVWTRHLQQKSEEASLKNLLNFVTDEMKEQKVLGVVWEPDRDLLLYKVSAAEIQDKDMLTKRMVLSEIAKVFDPTGLAAALLIKGKILMQKLWQLGCEWDDDLPEERKEEWKRFFKELRDLDGLSFERCLMPECTSKPADLIIFCDASEEAFGAVVYIRWELDDQTIIEWPRAIPKADSGEIDKERKKSKSILITREIEKAIDCKRFSKWRKLV